MQIQRVRLRNLVAGGGSSLLKKRDMGTRAKAGAFCAKRA